MRFFKIFLIVFFSLIGTVGVILGIMYLAGYFTKPTIYPDQISFSQERFLVDDDFEMKIETSTEDVTMLDVTLSFPSHPNQNGEYITDGIITVPRYVKIGQPFTVTLNKSLQNLGEETLSWIVGGISTLEAKSENIESRSVQTKVYVDVPVHSLKVTSKIGLQDQHETTEFNVDSNFWVQAKFIPARSQFKYSQDGSDGNEIKNKTIFFSTISNDIEETEFKDNFAQQYHALFANNNVVIKAQSFVKTSDEEDAFKAVEGFADEIAKENLLTMLSNAIEEQRGVQSNSEVKISELVVGGYNVTNVNPIPSAYNVKFKLFANKENLLENEYSFGIKIFATDNSTPLQSEIKNIAIGVFASTANGIEPASSLVYNIEGSEALNVNILGKSYIVYKPFNQATNINHAYWNLAVLGEELNLKVFVLLLDEAGNIKEFSLTETKAPKFSINVDSTNIISNQIYWKDATQQTRKLYIYDAEDAEEKIYQQFDLKSLDIVVPAENTYKEVKYFAYIENSAAEELDLNDYIVTLGTEIVKSVTTGLEIKLYEIPNGILTPKDEKDFPSSAKIRVVFATIKTDLNGSAIYDENNTYVFDRISSISALGTVQALEFEIVKTLKQIDSKLVISYDPNSNYYDSQSQTLAFVQNTQNAFNVVLSVASSKKDTLIKEWNEGKIVLLFENNKGQEGLLGYSHTNLTIDDGNEENGKFEISIPISISSINYLLDDTGDRIFNVFVKYQRGNQPAFSSEVTNFECENFENQNPDDNSLQGVIIPSVLEIYDGKIATLSFEESLKNANGNGVNFVLVETNLEKEKNANQEEIINDGIFTASKTSSFSISYGGDKIAKDWVFEDDGRIIRVDAGDKYGKQIIDRTLWDVISSNSNIVAIEQSTKTMSFVKASDELVKISLNSANGVGGKSIAGKFDYYLKVQTGGEVLGIFVNPSNTLNGDRQIYKNFLEDSNNKFTMQDESKSFTETSLTIELEAKKDRNIELYGNAPFFKTLYGISVDENLFEIYDLKNILKFSKANQIFEDDNGYVEFIYEKDGMGNSTEYITSFKILKDFGKIGYLNLNVTSSVGFNIALNIVLKPVVSVSVDNYLVENAQSSSDGGITYVGVFAQNEINFNFYSLNELESTMQVTPIIYQKFIDENDRVITQEIYKGNKTALKDLFTFNDITNRYEFLVNATLNDVAGYVNSELIFVLDSGNGIVGQNYEPLLYDFTQSLYVRINPNVTASVNDNITADRENENEITIFTNNNNIATVLSINSSTTPSSNSLIIVKRVVGDAYLYLFNDAQTNYVSSYISDERGNRINHEYFVLEDNQLNIRSGKLLQGFQTVYITVVHVVDGAEYTVKIFKINIKADIQENGASQFVTYEGVRYLQLLAGTKYSFEDLKSFFKASNNDALLSVGFDSKYVNSKVYYNIVTNGLGEIDVFASSIILANNLEIEVNINGVGKVAYPVIIMPKLAPLVMYEEGITSDFDDFDRGERNAKANADLKNLLSIEYLVANDIYDVVSDAEAEVDIKAIFGTKNNGIYVEDEDNAIYSLRDGNGGYSPISSASITQDGILTTYAVGEDEYVIVVVSVKGFEFYYRLRIKASLSLQTYYPFDSQNQAEYVLFRTSDMAKTINLTADFNKEIPATSRKGKWSDENISNDKINIFNRFILLKDNNLFENYEIDNIVIKSITLGYFNSTNRQPVDSANYFNYAFIEKYDDRIDLTLKNMGNYVVELEVSTNNRAKATYYFAIEQSNKMYSLVTAENGGVDISNLPEVENDRVLYISSPLLGEGETTDETLTYWYLKMNSGSVVSDVTNEVNYHISNSHDVFSLTNNNISAKYSVNDVSTELIVYTKYGILRKIPLVLKSKIGVYDKDNAELGIYLPIHEKDIISANEINLNDFLEFYEKDEDVYNFKQVLWKDINFETEQPYFIKTNFGNNPNSIEPKMTILPILSDISVVLNCVVSIDNQDFKFNFTLNLKTAFDATSDNQLAPSELGQVFATQQKNIAIFNDGVFISNANNLEFKYENSLITASLSGVEQNFELFVTFLTGGNYCAINSVANNIISFDTFPTSQIVDVLIKFELKFGDYFSLISYCNFTILPEVSIEVNYPAPNGIDLLFESLHFESGFNLNSAAEFQNKNRIQMIESFNGAISNAYLKYLVKEGSINIVGGEVNEDGFDIDSSFNFNFDGLSNNYALIDFEIYVNGLIRTVYSLKVYKEISEIYSISINTINQMDGNNEVFYVVEDRKDIFNGIQAFKFTLNNTVNILSNQTNIEVFLYENSKHTKITDFILTSADRGQTKTIKLNYSDSLAKLTLDNIRFKVGDSPYLTLMQMSQGNYPYFATKSTGDIDFVLLHRIAVKYLGYDINDVDFLRNIKVQTSHEETGFEESAVPLKDFKLNYAYLGGDVLARLGNVVKITYGNNGNLGTYTYDIRVNIQKGYNEEFYDIYVGQEVDRLLSQLSISKRDGTQFVVYNNDNSFVIDSLILNSYYKFNMLLKQRNEESRYNYFDAQTGKAGQPYLIDLSNENEPLYISYVSETASSIYYDFKMLAHGAPNEGLVATLQFVIDIKDNPALEFNENDGESVEEVYLNNAKNGIVRLIFEQDIKIIPDWEFKFLNIDGSENSENTPQIIGQDIFGGNSEYNLVLVDNVNTNNTKIFAYHTQNSQFVNEALSLTYKVNNDTFVSVNKTSTSVIANIKNSDFAVRNFAIEVSDVYGYTKAFYVQVEPAEKLIFNKFSGNINFYEGDSFAIKLNDGADVEHFIELNKMNFDENYQVSFELYKTDGTKITNGLSDEKKGGIGRKIYFNYLDSQIFSSTTNTVGVYLQLSFTKEGVSETYVVKTSNFMLCKRYVIATSNLNVRDNVDFNLINHLEVKDLKENLNIANPIIKPEMTLVTEKTKEKITVKALYNNQTITQELQIEDNYTMLSDIFTNITDIQKCNYIITKVENNLGEIFEIANSRLFMRNIETKDASYIVHLSNGTRYLSVQLVASISNNGKYESDYYNIEFSNMGIVAIEKNGVVASITSSEEEGQTIYNFELSNIISGLDYSLINTNETGLGEEGKYITAKTENVAGQINIILYNEVGAKISNINDGKIILPSGNGQVWEIASRNDSSYVDYTFKEDKRIEILTIDDGKEEHGKININFTGQNKYLSVELNKNGLQTFSMLKQLGDSSYDFAEVVISDADLSKAKGMTYYNDTLSIKTTPSSTGAGNNLSFSLNRIRNGIITERQINVQVNNYARTSNFGISSLFGEMIEEGDVYSLSLFSITGVSMPKNIIVTWPNSSLINIESQNIEDYLGSKYGNYTVIFDDIVLQDGKENIKIDSQGLYDAYASSSKKLDVTKYYLLEYRGAKYLSNPTFKVSPFFFEIKTNSGLDRVVINEYSKTEENGKAVYTASLDSWGREIFFADGNNKVIKENGSIVYLNQKQNLINITLDSSQGGSGAGRIDENNNLIVDAGIDLENQYFTAVVSVALNGIDGAVEWLKIGSIKLYFNSKSTYFLPNNNQSAYSIFTSSKISEQNDETYLRFIKYKEGTSAVTISPISLFAGHSLNVENAGVTSNNLNNYYLQEAGKYRVSHFLSNDLFVDFNVEASSLSQEEQGANRPVVMGGVKSGETINLTGFLGSIKYVGSFTNNTDFAIFDNIKLSDFTWEKFGSDGQKLETDNGYENCESFVSDKSYVYVAFSKLDLSEILQEYQLQCYDGVQGNPDSSSNAFFNLGEVIRIRKIEDGDELTSVQIDSANGKANYLISQLDIEDNVTIYNVSKIYSMEGLNVNGLNKYEVELTGDKNKTYDFIIVQKKTNFAIDGVYSIKLDGNYLYQVGYQQDSVFEYNLEIMMNNKLQNFNKIELQNLYFVNPFAQSLNNKIPTLIITKDALAKGSSLNNTVVNINTNGNKSYVYFEGELNNNTNVVPFDDDIKVVLHGDINTYNKLVWHEMMNDMPLGVVYWKKTNNQSLTNNEYVTNEISELQNGDVISNLWNGTFNYFVGGITDYMYVEYDGNKIYLKTKQDDTKLLFKNGKFLVGELFKNNESYDYIDISKFTKDLQNNILFPSNENEISILMGTNGYGIYDVKNGNEHLAFVNYNANSNPNMFTAFGMNIIKSNLISFTEMSFEDLNWVVAQAGYYAVFCEEREEFKIVKVEEENLFVNIFEIFDLQYIGNWEYQIQKINQTSYNLNIAKTPTNEYLPSYTEGAQKMLNIKIVCGSKEVIIQHLIVSSELNGDNYVISISLEDYLLDFNATTFSIMQVNEIGEEMTTPIFTKIENISLI